MNRLIALCLLLVTGLLPLAACNTVHGFGEDVSAAGHTITGASH